MSSLESFNDDELLQLLKSNNERAFSEIYNRYWRSVFALANNRLKNQMEAEEAVEDVFIGIWRSRAKLDIKYTLKTYLSVSVKYSVFRRISKEYAKWNNIKEYSLNVQDTDTTGLWMDVKELEDQLRSCIDLLPKKCKIIFLKSRFEEKTYAQIAGEMNISVKTVEGHITKALHILRGLITIFLFCFIF